MYGDIPSLATGQTTVAPRREYRLIRIGHAMSCGADTLTYSLTVSPGAGGSAEPIDFTVPVRPVYHIGATAMFGFDTTNRSTFGVRDGRITEAIDRVGPRLLVGGTYFIKGVDFGDMRWYNHLFNPFVVVSLASPRDGFVMGNALTYSGGISLGVGVAFNHVPTLASGFTVSQEFAGQGDVPQNRTWDRGIYIGIGVDNRLMASLSKLKRSGTGGGTSASTPADPKAKEAEAEKKSRSKRQHERRDTSQQG